MESILHQSQTTFEFPVGSNRWDITIEIGKIKRLINIPDIQRELNEEWIHQLSNSIMLDPWRDVGRLDLVCLNDEFYLVNGQHRFALLSTDYEDTKLIQFKVYKVSTEEEMNIVFQNVNHSRPVMIVGSTSDTIIHHQIRRYMNDNFKSYMSGATKPRPPNFNLDHMMEAFKDKWVFPPLDRDIDLIHHFIQYMERVNTNIILKYALHPELGSKIRMCQHKQVDKPFVLGLFHNFEWMTNEHADFMYKRLKITIKTRSEVWRKEHGLVWTSVCPICNDNLEHGAFECGHIISHYNGGSTNIDNLRAICQRCNRTMGTMNMNDYTNQRTASTPSRALDI